MIHGFSAGSRPPLAGPFAHIRMTVKTFVLGKRHGGRTLAAVVGELAGVAGAELARYLKNRWVRLDGAVCARPGQRVGAGQKLQVVLPRPARARSAPSQRRGALPQQSVARQPPRSALPIPIVYLDEHIVVVDKPAGLTTVRHADEKEEFGSRAQRFLPPTLVDLLPALLPGGPAGRVRAVHRLDKETSGLVVLARSAAAERHLGQQFRGHRVERTYLALVRGAASEGRIESYLVRDRGDGRRGSDPEGRGQRAVTHIRVLEKLGDSTLLECRLETGRTHQVRIHLGERGTPLCGERIYDRPPHGRPAPDASGAKRPLLHAATLTLEHPATGKRLCWQAAPPKDMRDILARLRRSV
jgi:23S rRNA pseudouridine1911/1915/1917 synthase